ncbi:MAG: methyl-accepting chemotaxis protein, partial [Solirubrobacterales bacterium]
AAASAEQASGIDQVNSAVTQMDEMTQQNAALVEESAAAAHALEEQSRELNRLMSFFHVGQQAAQAPAAGTARADRPAAKAAAKPAAKPVQKSQNARTHLAKLHTTADNPTPAPAAAATKGGDEDWAEF